MSSFIDLPDDEVDDLLTPKKSSPTRGVPGTNKRVRYDDSIRTVANWFKLEHTVSGTCEVPTHLDDPERPVKLLYINQKGIRVCRWCFIEGRDLQE